eukprot:425470-Pleurochrysis_carterae.AAC.1
MCIRDRKQRRAMAKLMSTLSHDVAVSKKKQPGGPLYTLATRLTNEHAASAAALLLFLDANTPVPDLRVALS